MRGDISRISGTVMPTLWSDGYEAKLAVAEEQGLSALFIVQESFEKNLPRVIYYLKKPRLVLNLPQVESIPVIYVSKGMVPRIFNDYDSDALKKLLSSGQDIYGLSRNGVMKFNLKKSVLPVSASNVVGCVKGTDLASEYVFVSGHYDHLGMREGTIFYGADDNGSGTSSILEIARLFAEAKRNGHGPRRTIVFLLVSGEEKGLLGSEYYVEHPLVPLRETVVDLNVDMIGRSDKLYEDSIQDYIYLIGSNKLSNELHQVSEEVNNKFSKLLLDYRYNDPNDPQRLYYRSDHYNFAKHKIPVIFYFRGLHDDYHLPSDTYDKIEFSTIEKVSKLIFMTAWEIANRETRLLIDEEVD